MMYLWRQCFNQLLNIIQNVSNYFDAKLCIVSTSVVSKTIYCSCSNAGWFSVLTLFFPLISFMETMHKPFSQVVAGKVNYMGLKSSVVSLHRKPPKPHNNYCTSHQQANAVTAGHVE